MRLVLQFSKQIHFLTIQFLSIAAMKVIRLGLWSIWLSGLILIGLSIYATQKLAALSNVQIKNYRFNLENPRIAIFTAPKPFTGSVGSRQSLAIRSWVGLSPQITVVLFSQDPSVAGFAGNLSSRILVEPNIDFTFLGTPFFHSMVARAQAFPSDISVIIDPRTILMPDFISTLNHVYKFDHDWLLVASPKKVSYFPFYLTGDGKYWLGNDGKRVSTEEFQGIVDQSWQWNNCEGTKLMAWNSAELPLHTGVLPPFLYGKGMHNQWLISEALSSEIRIVFDGSLSLSSFSLDDFEHWSNNSGRGSYFEGAEKRSWEFVGNSHLGALYGSSSLQEISYFSLLKLFKCNRQYLFVNTTASAIYPVTYDEPDSWKGKILPSLSLKKVSACLADTKVLNRTLNCSVAEKLKPSAPLDYPFSLKFLLPTIADKNRTIVLAVAGYSYRDMLMSWVCRLRHLRVTNFVVCALDDETYQFSILQGLPVFTDPLAPANISFNDCHFGTKCFQRVTKVKSRIVLQILKLGYNVLLSDVDVYWFRNPFPLLYSYGPSVLAAQSDEYNITRAINVPRRLNSGFYFARSDSATIAAMEKVVKHAATSGLSEQPSFYDILCGKGGSNRVGDDRCLEPETNLTVHFLDRNLFPNGAYLELWQKKNLKRACTKMGCFVLHNNWISGRLKKVKRQVSSGLWEYDISTRMCTQRWQRSKLLAKHKDRNYRRKEELMRGSLPLDLTLQSSRDLSVRIIHAGGKEELYQNAVPVSKLMEKNPGMCIARSEVFKNPHKSLMWPDENLVPGQKYYMIPSSTAKKLKRRHCEKVRVKKPVNIKEDTSDARITWDMSGDDIDACVSSAKEFYVSRVGSLKTRVVRKGKPFRPPLPKQKMFYVSGWEPSLTSVQELSP